MKYLKCLCQHCKNPIEFESSHIGEMTECPHCHYQTFLKKNSFKRRDLFAGGLVILFLMLALILIKTGNSQSVDWVDSGSAVTNGVLRVSITYHKIGTLLQSNGERLGDTPMQSSYLIQVHLQNLSHTEKIELSTWRFGIINSHAAELSDDNGNQYSNYFYQMPLESLPDQITIYPDSWGNDVVSFQIPVQNYKYLRLKLPASAFGGEGIIGFQINKS